MSAEREHFADELRGFALLGIVLVNAPFLGLSWGGYTSQSLNTWLDQLAGFGVVAFAQAKFYVLFAFLFGYSLSFTLKDASPLMLKRYRRRLFALLMIGAAHVVLFFIGDILMLYSLLGVTMIALTKQTDQVVKRVISWSLVAWTVILSLAMLLVWLYPQTSPSGIEHNQSINAIFAQGSFIEVAQMRINLWPSAAMLIGTLNGAGIMAMFALGLLAGRHKMLALPHHYTALWQRGSRLGLLIGLPCGLLSAWLTVGPGAQIDQPGMRETLGLVIGFITAPLLTWGYVSWLAQLRARFNNALVWFRSSGRMTLTGYIAESALLSLIFCGYGLGWFGKLGAFKVALIGLAVWLLIELMSKLWLRWQAQGPLEWLLARWIKHGE